MDNDLMSVAVNLIKAWRIWEWLSRILGRGGTEPWTPGTFYKVVVQAILLFGVETWDMTSSIGRTLGSFHHRVSYQMAVIWPRREMMVRWFKSPMDAIIIIVGLEGVDTYVLRLHNIL